MRQLSVLVDGDDVVVWALAACDATMPSVARTARVLILKCMMEAPYE
jgi:hypothetical protein